MRLRAYYVYQAAANSVFFAAVFYVYYERHAGLALPTILWIQSYFVALRAVLEMPLGALADRFSRRACLVAHALGTVTGCGVVLVWPTFWGVVATETVFAVASAARSGADSALLHDSLQAHGRLAEYPRAESRAQAVVAFASGAAAVVGGLLAALDLRLVYVATIVSGLACAGAAWRLDERRLAVGRERVRFRRLLALAGVQVRTRPAVRWVMALAAVAVAASHVYYYLQQPFLTALSVPLAAFGVVTYTIKALTALVATGAHRVDRRLGVRGVAGVMIAAGAGGAAAMSALVPAGVGALVVARGVLDGLWQPLLNVYMNRLVGSDLRATMLSAQSLVARLTLSATLMLLGAGSARLGLASTLAAAAVMVAVLGAALVLRAARAGVLAGPVACDSRGA